MELKRARVHLLELLVESLNRTFYGIETWQLWCRCCRCVLVLIVPFMELKRQLRLLPYRLLLS